MTESVTDLVNRIRRLGSGTAKAVTASGVDCPQNENNEVKEREIYNDSSFYQENKEDRKLNREQRERIAKKTFLMMSWEVSVTGFLLLCIFSVPFLNALHPRLSINLPPVFLTLSMIIGYLFICRHIDFLPDIYLSSKKLNLKKTKIKTSSIIKSLFIILFVIILNILPRKSYIFNYNEIKLSTEITNIILYTALAVFVKTTYLGHCIIKALYDLLKNHKLD